MADHRRLITAIIGAVLQCAAVNPGMLIAGRLIAGLGCGQILGVVPIYLAEAAPPKDRGFLVGLQGMLIAIGFAVANWVGYAGSYAKGNAQWRVPLAMQLPIPLVLLVCLFFVPYSPRWRKSFLIRSDFTHTNIVKLFSKIGMRRPKLS